jgi:calmodulin
VLKYNIPAYRESFQVFDTGKKSAHLTPISKKKNRSSHDQQNFLPDGDGKLSPEELTAVMRSLDQTPTQEQLEAIMHGLDTDHDGTIDFEEFLALMSAHSNSNNADDEIRSAFETFDKDKNGTINIEELRSMMKRLRVSVTEEELSVMMKEADEDGDGVIDFQGASALSLHLADHIVILLILSLFRISPCK